MHQGFSPCTMWTYTPVLNFLIIFCKVKFVVFWWKRNERLNVSLNIVLCQSRLCPNFLGHMLSKCVDLLMFLTTPTKRKVFMCGCLSTSHLTAQLSATLFLDLPLPVSPAPSEIFILCGEGEKMREEGGEENRNWRERRTARIAYNVPVRPGPCWDFERCR